MSDTHTTLIRILAEAIRDDPQHPYVAAYTAISVEEARYVAWTTCSAAEKERILLAAVRKAQKASER